MQLVVEEEQILMVSWEDMDKVDKVVHRKEDLHFLGRTYKLIVGGGANGATAGYGGGGSGVIREGGIVVGGGGIYWIVCRFYISNKCNIDCWWRRRWI